MIGVESAGIRQNPQSRFTDSLDLRTNRRVRSVEARPIGAKAENSDQSRRILANLSDQGTSAGSILFIAELRCRRRCTAYQVGNSVSGLEQLVVLPWSEKTFREARPVERRPEAITGSPEVQACCAGVETRVDADEEDSKIGPDQVRDAFPIRALQLFLSRFSKFLSD